MSAVRALSPNPQGTLRPPTLLQVLPAHLPSSGRRGEAGPVPFLSAGHRRSCRRTRCPDKTPRGTGEGTGTGPGGTRCQHGKGSRDRSSAAGDTGRTPSGGNLAATARRCPRRARPVPDAIPHASGERLSDRAFAGRVAVPSGGGRSAHSGTGTGPGETRWGHREGRDNRTPVAASAARTQPGSRLAAAARRSTIRVRPAPHPVGGAPGERGSGRAFAGRVAFQPGGGRSPHW